MSTRVGTAILALLMISIVISRIVYPFDTGNIEAFAWVPTANLLGGTNPYAYALTPPYSMVPYGIVYYALLAVGQSIFGLQMWFGRILSVLACAVCVWAVARITNRFTAGRDAVWVACLVSLALFPVQAWVGVMRSDLISVAFGLTAVSLVLAVRENERISAVRISAIVLLAVAAVFTKHTTLLPAVVIFLRLLQLSKRRDAAIFSIAFSLFAGAAVLALNSTSEGGYVWQHFIHARRLPFSIAGWRGLVCPLALTPTSLIFTAALLLLVYHRRGEIAEVIARLRSPTLLISFYLFLSLIIAAVSSGRVGANVNYFLEASFVVAVVSGLIFEEFRQGGLRRTAAALSLLMVIGGILQVVRITRGEFFRWQSLSYYREISDSAARYTSTGSRCVSVYAELVARNGCELHFDDYGEYVGGWSPELTAVFRKEVAAGEYSVIIWSSDKFQEEFPGYRLVPMSQPPPEKFFPVYLYVRKTDLEVLR